MTVLLNPNLSDKIKNKRPFFSRTILVVYLGHAFFISGEAILFFFSNKSVFFGRASGAVLSS